MHWFGLKPWELDNLTAGEINELLNRLKKMPPPGWVFAGAPKDR